MQEMLHGLGIEIIGLNDIKMNKNQIDESGNIPLENARIKAMSYYDIARIPVFASDSGLYIEGIRNEEQPGVHVRRVGGKELNDDEMIEYYSNLAEKYGGELKAKYRNAIALVLDEDTIFTYDGEDISSEDFIITSKVHEKRRAGFPLDSISLEYETKKYYFDIDSNRISFNDGLVQGFRDFFTRTVLSKV